MKEPREIELKLELDPSSVRGFARRASSALGRPDEVAKRLRSIYYDTRKHALQRQGLSLRLREDGDRRIQTLKASGAGAGLFDRAEWETEAPDAGGPDPGRFDAEIGGSLQSGGSLAPVFETRVDRTTWTVQEGASAVEVSLDNGTVSADGAESPLAEVELELKHGSAQDLFGVARRLAEAGRLRIGVRSKSERGYALIGGGADRIAKAEPIRLTRRMSAGQAFQAIARSCLRQFRLNEARVVQARDPDALHQARVGIRRLRSAMSLFGKVIADEEQDRMKREFRALSVLLGEARNLDVYRARASVSEQERRPDEPGLFEYAARIAAEREAAYDRVVRKLASKRFRDFTLDFAAWLEAGPWLSSPALAAVREQKVWRFARPALARHRRKVRRTGRHLDRIAPEARHEVRIAAKKLRYASEFSASLVRGRKAKRRHEAFVSALETLQDQLGDLNDIHTGRETAERVALAGPGARRTTGGAPLPLFAAGHVAGEEGEREAEVLRLAAAAHADFRNAKPFWRA